MKTVKIYKVTCTKAYMMGEQGVCHRLTPWGHNTEYYEGYDDGGQDYKLHDGYRVSESQSGTLEIYGAGGNHCDIVTSASGNPQIVSSAGVIDIMTIKPHSGRK